MKKNLFSTLAFVSFAGSMLAQLPVSTAPQNKKAVLEEFTGIYCGYCPDGHQIANAIHANDPNNVILINIHSGYYATAVVPGEPDLTTPEGTAIDGMAGMGIAGYPAGDVNRTVFASGAQTANMMAGNRTSWNSWANNIKSQPAYCNVALQGTVNVVTRMLTVEAQVYYTASSPVATNYLTVMMLEDGVAGPQHNYGTPVPYNAANYNPDESYNHNHVLRKALTPTFGTPINTTSAGTTFSTTLTYNIPLTYGMSGKTNPCMLGNLELVAFVTESNVKTINGNRGPITLTGFTNSLDLAPTTLKTDANVCLGNNFNASFKFTNMGSTPVTSADFDYAVNGTVMGSINWNGNVDPMSSSLANIITPFSFAANPTNTITITATSINGSGPDQNAANNIVTKSIPYAPIAQSVYLTFNFAQDRWGTESTWAIQDEATSSVVLYGGPYTTLGASGTLLHTSTVAVAPNTCYQVIVNDAAGDGINSGYGAGYYNLKANNLVVFSSNGIFADMDTKLFKTKDTTSIPTSIGTLVQHVKSVSVFPNPSSGVTNLSVNLSQNETINVSVLNSIGQEIYSSKGNNFSAGTNNLTLNTENWASGVYFINVSTLDGSLKRKLTVSH